MTSTYDYSDAWSLAMKEKAENPLSHNHFPYHGNDDQDKMCDRLREEVHCHRHGDQMQQICEYSQKRRNTKVCWACCFEQRRLKKTPTHLFSRKEAESYCELLDRIDRYGRENKVPVFRHSSGHENTECKVEIGQRHIDRVNCTNGHGMQFPCSYSPNDDRCWVCCSESHTIIDKNEIKKVQIQTKRPSD